MQPIEATENLTWVAPTITGIFAGIVGLIALLSGYLTRRDQRNALPLTPLDEKIELVSVTTGQLSRLNDEIKAEFEARLLEVQRLQREADDAIGAASLHKEAAENVQNLVKSQMRAVSKENAKRDRFFQVSLSAFFFVLGIVATLLLQGLGK